MYFINLLNKEKGCNWIFRNTFLGEKNIAQDFFLREKYRPELFLREKHLPKIPERFLKENNIP